MMKIQDIFKKISKSPELIKKFQNEQSIESICELCRKIEPNITDEEIKKGLLSLISKTNSNRIIKFDDDELEMVSGGMDFKIFKTSAVASLLILGGVSAINFNNKASAHEYPMDTISSSFKEDNESIKDQKTLNDELFGAIRKNDKAAVESLIEKGADVNAKDNYGQTPLMLASLNNNLESAKLLIDKGADVNAKDSADESALYKAMTKRYANILELLLSKDVKKEEIDKSFLYAAERGDLQLMKLFIKFKADLETKNKYGQSALIIAANNGYTNAVKLLLESGSDINAVDNYNNTPLMHALNKNIRFSWTVSHNHISPLISNEKAKIDIAKILIEKGADLNIVNKSGQSPLIRSLVLNYDISKLLIDKGANVNAQTDDKVTPLMIAAASGCKKEVMELLIEKGAEINSKDIENKNALMHALENLTVISRFGRSEEQLSRKQDIEKIKILLEKDADVKEVNMDGRTTLMNAIIKKADIDIIRTLIERGVDVNSSTKYNDTALMYAASRNDLESMKLLIDKGAKVNVCNMSGYTPLMRAESKEAIELLLNNGADINAVDKDGRNALMLAVSWTQVSQINEKETKVHDQGSTPNGNSWAFYESKNKVRTGLVNYSKSIDVIKFLIEKGANVNIKDKYGQGIYSLAVEKNRKDVVNLLKDNQEISQEEKRSEDNGRLLIELVAHHRFIENRLEKIKNLLEEKHINVNAKDEEGRSPLEIAAVRATFRSDVSCKDDPSVVKLLLERGADAKDSLLWAGKKELVDLLLEHGADVQARDKDGKTTLMHKEDPEVVRTLIERGVDVNAKDNKGITALMYLSLKNSSKEVMESLKILVENGAKIDERDSRGKTALDFARNVDSRENTVRFLENALKENGKLKF